MTGLRPLALHLPDADHLTGSEIAAVMDLAPCAMLGLVYAQWDNDKGASDQISDLVMALGHDRLYVRFHADPHPPGYAKKIGGPEAWGRLCAQRMTQYYEPLERAGVQLHAILANETDADYEGGLSVGEASEFHRRSMNEYAAKRPSDILHVPAPTGAPQTHRDHLERFKADGWVRPEWWIDGHGYDGDLENVLNVLADVFPGHQYAITETNDLNDFGWPLELIRQGRVRDVVYFILNWARGGEGRVRPPTPDDAAKRMSLLRFPDRYRQFMAIPPTVSEPEPIPPEPVMPDPYEFWSAETIAAVTKCPLDAVTEHWPKLVEQLGHCGIVDKPVQMAMIGTVAIETASTFAPVREAFWLDEAWRAANLRYHPYYGRGYIQLTWESNYAAYGPKVAELWGTSPDQPDFDLVGNPDQALNPDIAAAVASLYFRDHGREDGDGIPEAARRGDWREVRRLVQGGSAGLDRLVEIVGALGADVPTAIAERIYGANIPDAVVRQQNSWTCAVRSAYAALWAMARQGTGQTVTYGDGGPDDVYEWMVPEYDQPNVGLLDHTGAGLAQMLREHRYAANSAYPVTLDQVLERAGQHPVLLGGDAWHHWVMVRGRTNDGGLILENPMPGHGGIDDYLRDSFGRLGPMAMVWIEGQAAPESEPPTYEQLATLEGVAYHESGTVIPALVNATRQADVNQMRQEVEAVVAFLRASDPHGDAA